MTAHNLLALSLKKIVSIIFFLIIFFVLPLSAKPSLLLNWQVIFLACICAILFATQPRLSISESRGKKATDKNTIWLIIIISAAGQITSLIEWAYFSRKNTKTEAVLTDNITGVNLPLDFAITNHYSIVQNNFSLWIVAGIFLLIAGTVFRLYSIHTLGKYFSATVQIKNEHQIINNGPYKLLRHPSYTGAYFAMLGSAVFLHSFAGILFFGVGMLFIYHLRIKTEEQTMIENFGKEYLNYSRNTWKMFPLIW